MRKRFAVMLSTLASIVLILCILFTALVKFSINVLLVNTSVLLRNFDTLVVT